MSRLLTQTRSVAQVVDALQADGHFRGQGVLQHQFRVMTLVFREVVGAVLNHRVAHHILVVDGVRVAPVETIIEVDRELVFRQGDIGESTLTPTPCLGHRTAEAHREVVMPLQCDDFHDGGGIGLVLR